MNKQKIFNDPVHGFIKVPGTLAFDIIEHPYFQRLRRIRQLGLTDYVYPGALHTRFHHALGAMHLMCIALAALREKGIEISQEEWDACVAAMLLHDIGHGPFSHTLEHEVLRHINHEQISLLLMQEMDKDLGGRLGTAIAIFTNQYHRRFFNQLIASQLDIDRIDYLRRDSFFTGVTEGSVGSSRILKMLNVADDYLVIEEKGIYSVEAFLSARRLMYWQVYFHKTAISAELLLVQIVRRAKALLAAGTQLYASEALMLFLQRPFTLADLQENPLLLRTYAQIDDFDVWACIKDWSNHGDYVLATLCKCLLHRRLFAVKVSNEPFAPQEVAAIEQKVAQQLNIPEDQARYFVIEGTINNSAYLASGSEIRILMKDGRVLDLADASDLPHIQAMRRTVKKHYLCWHKSVSLL